MDLNKLQAMPPATTAPAALAIFSSLPRFFPPLGLAPVAAILALWKKETKFQMNEQPQQSIVESGGSR